MAKAARIAARRQAIDGASRRRLYLFRHGSVDYIDENGDWVEDPDIVDLNERGRAQAAAMARLFAGVHVDKALCTGLPRTRQTGETILADREIELGVVAELEEIRPLKGQSAGGYDIYAASWDGESWGAVDALGESAGEKQGKAASRHRATMGGHRFQSRLEMADRLRRGRGQHPAGVMLLGGGQARGQRLRK